MPNGLTAWLVFLIAYGVLAWALAEWGWQAWQERRAVRRRGFPVEPPKSRTRA